MKSLEGIRERRENLLIDMKKTNDEKIEITQNMEKLSQELEELNNTLQYKEELKKEFDKVISNTEKAYYKLLDGSQTLLAILKRDEATPYSRFLPIAKFIEEDNRFSPPYVEWLYLAIGDTDKHIRECAEAECRAEKGNRFGFCHFTLNKIYDNKPIVDLTKFANESYDTLIPQNCTRQVLYKTA